MATIAKAVVLLIVSNLLCNIILFNLLQTNAIKYNLLRTNSINYRHMNGLNERTQIAHKQYISDTSALCLDGSQAVYYFKPGIEINKWVIYFPGTAWCTGFDETIISHRIKSCIAFSTRTSTNNIPNSIDLNSLHPITAVNSLVINSNKTQNPLLYNWNHVYVHYCDGSSFSSNLDQPILYKTNKYFYRGKIILDAMFKDLINEHNLLNATNIIIAGSSSGALTVYLHANYINNKYISQLKNPSVLLLTECGFFIDSNGIDNHVTNYSDAMKWIYDYTNVSTNVQCEMYMESIGKNKNLCMFAENVVPFINISMFVIQSKYDYWSIKNVFGIKYYEIKEVYGSDFQNRIYGKLMQSDVNGLFLHSCRQHCGAWNTVSINGTFAFEAFDSFYNKSKLNTRLWAHNNSISNQECN
eukprot:196586_1